MTPAQVDDLTYHDFTVLLHAHELREVDQEYRAHKQAFLNQVVKQTEGTGKNIRPQYPTLASFYDYAQELDKIQHPEKHRRQQRIRSAAADFAAKYNTGGEG